MAWTTLNTNNLLAGEPLVEQETLAFYENPIAIAEGAAGAPLISGAMRKIQDNQEIGAYIFARRSGTTEYGQVRAGSSLNYAGGLNLVQANSGTDGSGGAGSIRSFTMGAGVGGAPSGSWVCLGHVAATSSMGTTIFGGSGQSNSSASATLWQRVS
jgi:hypothetical protein